jgi:hypothetical protein
MKSILILLIVLFIFSGLVNSKGLKTGKTLKAEKNGNGATSRATKGIVGEITGNGRVL